MNRPGSFYIPDGDGFAATGRAVSPWNPANQNGIAIIALMTHLIERTPTLEPMMLARLTLDIARPLSMGAFDAECRVVREGRRQQVLEVGFRRGGEICARATALRVRLAHSPVSAEVLDYPAPEDTPDRPLTEGEDGNGRFRTRVLRGGRLEPGPGSGWAQPAAEVLPGVPASPLVAAAMAADIGSGLSSELERRDWTFANVDVALHFVRPPESDWIYVDARTVSAGQGSGLVSSILADRRGPFARAHQTLFVERAATAARADLETARA